MSHSLQRCRSAVHPFLLFFDVPTMYDVSSPRKEGKRNGRADDNEGTSPREIDKPFPQVHAGPLLSPTGTRSK
ncbi:hypothetical protein JTE90_021105, partial [Oedothorax gibbosus]